MNKKGLSILLALSMVFSLNSMAFAEEAVVTDEAVVAVASEDVEVTQSSQSYNAHKERLEKIANDPTLVSCNNVSLGSTTLKVKAGGTGVFNYIGKKLTAASFPYFYVADSKTGYFLPVKKIKLTSNKKANAVGKVTFKIGSLGNAKQLCHSDWYDETVKITGDFNGNEPNSDAVTDVEAKTIYKSLLTQFKSGKNQEFSVYIADTWIEDSVSDAYIKDLKNKKKSLSMGDVKDLIGGDKNYVVITTKNGNVKKVQIPYVTYKFPKTNGSSNRDVYTAKVGLKTLKKGKDYTVSGDFVLFDSSETFTSSGPIKAK